MVEQHRLRKTPMQNQDNPDALAWHKRFAVQTNNRAWDLTPSSEPLTKIAKCWTLPTHPPGIGP